MPLFELFTGAEAHHASGLLGTRNAPLHPEMRVSPATEAIFRRPSAFVEKLDYHSGAARQSGVTPESGLDFPMNRVQGRERNLMPAAQHSGAMQDCESVHTRLELAMGGDRSRPSRILTRACLILLLALGFSAQPTWAQANVQGQWVTSNTEMPINPIHISLMHNGQVLVVSGSGNLPSDTNFEAGVWDPQTQTITTQPVQYDMFCNGIVVLPDGRPFVIGGTLQYDPFHGDPRTSAYDPVTGNFVQLQSMAHGRWYPTATTLSNGSVMVFSGLDENGNTNTTVEIYTVGAGWSQPYQAGWTPPLYPRMHLLPNGNVFYSGSTTSSAIFNPTNQTWQTGVATTNYSGTRTYGTSVLLPLLPSNGYKPVVMIMGGGSPATNTTELIDLSQPTPAWVYGPSMSQPRIEMDAVILPNGKVLALNGSTNDEDATTASLKADLYNPVSNTFSSAGQGSFARLYHSGALLLPDATVMVMGGNPERGTYEPHVEIYSPAYLFNSNGTLATRPSITSVTPGVIGYGATFQVQTPDAANISSAVLSRAGSPTHAFDMDQRLVGLNFTAGSGSLTVTSPPTSSIAPPGYYLLFLLNSSGVPSVAQFVQLSMAPADQPPTGIITSPTGSVTIVPNQAVNFAGSGTSPSGTIAGYSWVFPGGTPSSSTAQDPGAVTYSTPGTYLASLTVTDNSGVTDPDPPTVAVTVSPDFAISVSPSEQNVSPGGSSSYTVSLSAATGYSSTVSLSVSGLPTGASASFSSSSLVPPGSSNLTITTSSNTPTGTFVLMITGTATSSTHSANAFLNVTANSGAPVNSLSIQFVGNGVAMGSSEVAGVVPLSDWNPASGASSSSAMSLTDSTGAATTTTATWKADNTWVESIADQPGNVRMMRGYLDNGNQDTTIVTVSGLPSNASGYSVYIYANGSTNGSNTGIYQISGPGITTTNTSLTYSSSFNGTFTQATSSSPVGNYVLFTIPNVPSFTLSAIPSTSSTGYERAPVNAIQVVPIVPPNPNFSLSATPGTETVGLSSTATYSVTVAASGGFTGTVALSATGLPNGATASFSPAGVTTSGSSTLSVTTSSGTPIGSSTITVTGTSGTLTQSANVSLSVSGPDFTLSVTPGSASVIPGATATYTVSLNPLFGFTDAITLSATGLPTGASVSFNPASITPGTSSTMTVTTSANTPGGNATLTVTGTSVEEQSRSTNATLDVTAPDFTLTGSPSSVLVNPGNTANYTVSVGALNGFGGLVNLSVTNGLPAGATATFSPASVTGSGSASLMVATAGSTPTGSATLTITGTSGSLTHTATVTLVVTNASTTSNPISIQFVGNAVAMGGTEIAGVVALSNWNPAEGASSSSPMALMDSTGAATAATVSWKADNTWLESIADQPGNVRMMRGYLDNGQQDTTTITVTGLLSDPNGFAVYVYATGATNGSNTGLYQISGAGITTTSVSLTYKSEFNGSFTQADNSTGNYVMFTIPNASGFTLSAIPSTSSTGYERAPVNAIQIVPLGPPNPDFTVSVMPGSQSVNMGSAASYTVNVGVINGFSGAVSLGASGLPTGAGASFSPASVASPGSSALTITTSASTPTGNATITVSGTGPSGTVHNANVTLDVTAPDFTLSPSPNSFSVNPGGTANYTLNVGALNGFAGTVNLSVTSGLPAGATPTFSPSSLTGSGPSALMVATLAGTPTGTSTLTITGTSGSLTHTTTVTLVVTTASTTGNPISIQFVGNAVAMGSSEVAGVVALSNWNPAEGASSSSPMSLLDSTGASTNATVAWKSDDTWLESIADQPGNVRMMRGYLDNGQQDTTTITVTGLIQDPNGFRVYVYATGATSGTNTGIYQISGAGITTTSISLTYKSEFNGTFTQADNSTGNYVMFTIPSVSGFTLSAIPSTSSTGYERAPVNAIQIVPQ